MGKEIIIAEGLFSRLTISLSETTIQTLPLIDSAENPLASVEADLKRVLHDFETRYFGLTHRPLDGSSSLPGEEK